MLARIVLPTQQTVSCSWLVLIRESIYELKGQHLITWLRIAILLRFTAIVIEMILVSSDIWRAIFCEPSFERSASTVTWLSSSAISPTFQTTRELRKVHFLHSYDGFRCCITCRMENVPKKTGVHIDTIQHICIL